MEHLHNEQPGAEALRAKLELLETNLGQREHGYKPDTLKRIREVLTSSTI